MYKFTYKITVQDTKSSDKIHPSYITYMNGRGTVYNVHMCEYTLLHKVLSQPSDGYFMS